MGQMLTAKQVAEVNGREFLTFDIGGLGHRKKKPKDGEEKFEPEWKGTPQEAIEIIRAAVIVDEGIKVTVEAEKGK